MKSENNLIRTKRGYLNNDFEYFHLIDQENIEFEFHYHDFNKIVFFISGDVTYLIEGKSYKLKPMDILLVNRYDVHKPIINSNQPYERIVIWLNSKFLEMHSSEQDNLLNCFELSSREKRSLLRGSREELTSLSNTLLLLDGCQKDNEFGNQILKNSLFTQIIVYINRLFLLLQGVDDRNYIEYDEKIEDIISYIKGNLNEKLSIDELASKFFMNKYYLMHKFKEQTGYTLHNYIQQKRLAHASSLIRNGMPVTEACLECGFGDYSSFSRAFKKNFGLSPKDYYNESKTLEISYNKRKHY